jgi:hypothetical protein
MACKRCDEAAGLHEAALTAKRVGAHNTGEDLWVRAHQMHCKVGGAFCYCQCKMDAYDNS